MQVLVASASRHGSTAAISEAITAALAAHGLEVHQLPLQRVASVEPYDAVVVGSAVYMGRWLKPARDFITRHAHDLRAKPVWLFSSGPVGGRGEAGSIPDADAAMAVVEARGHEVFAGRLDVDAMAGAERLLVKAMRGRSSDDRDWDAIRAWADGIAQALGAWRNDPL